MIFAAYNITLGLMIRDQGMVCLYAMKQLQKNRVKSVLSFETCVPIRLQEHLKASK